MFTENVAVRAGMSSMCPKPERWDRLVVRRCLANPRRITVEVGRNGREPAGIPGQVADLGLRGEPSHFENRERQQAKADERCA